MLKNYSFMGLSQLIKYLVPLALTPFLSRTLEPTGWAIVIFFQVLIVWIGLIVEFGFNLSVIRDLAQSSPDNFKERVSIAESGVFGAKAVIASTVVIVFLFFLTLNKTLNLHLYISIISLFTGIMVGFIPFWYFQLIENYKTYALIEIAYQLCFVLSVFVFVRSPKDTNHFFTIFFIVTFLQLATYTFIVKREIKNSPVTLKNTLLSLKSSYEFFMLKVSVSLYTLSNTLILGLFLNPIVASSYANAERLMRGGASVLNPFTQVIYPRINHLISTDKQSAKNLFYSSSMLFLGLSILAALSLNFFSQFIVEIFLGNMYDEVVIALRYIVLSIPLISLNTILGLFILIPSKKERIFNQITIVGGLVNVVLNIFLIGLLSFYSAIFSIITAECTVLALSLFYVMKTSDLWIKK